MRTGGIPMARQPPLVDVLIPTIGRPSLTQAMLSALAQTYPRTRVIVAADANHLRTMNLFHRVNGLRRTMGKTIAELVTTPRPFGRGDRVKEWWIGNSDAAEIIHFVDDDDWIPPSAIAAMVAPMIDDPAVTLVTCSTLQLKLVDGSAVGYRLRPGRLERGQVVANSALFRKSAAGGVRLESDPADPRFWLHDIAERGKHVELTLPLYWYNATREVKPNPIETQR